jgi:hypothetical protein
VKILTPRIGPSLDEACVLTVARVVADERKSQLEFREEKKKNLGD